MSDAVEPSTAVRDHPPSQMTRADVEDFTERALDAHVNLAFRQNPYTQERYPGVFRDYDEDRIPTVDDPHPLTPGDVQTVEEVELSDEVGKLIDFRKRRKETTETARERLQKLAPEGATIKARTKTPYSIFNKLRRKRLTGEKGIDDVSGTMLVVRDYEELQLVRTLIEEEESLGPVEEVENHYDLPGPYRAVHYIVEVGGNPVELQLKTKRQSKLSTAAHTPYKRGVIDNEEMGRIAELAHRADTGDEEAADEVDQILRDTSALEQRLTEGRPNTRRQSILRGNPMQRPEDFRAALDVTVDFPTPGTDTGFEIESPSTGAYSYGFARRGDFDGQEYDRLAELMWIEVPEQMRGQNVGSRILLSTLRFLRATGARHVVVRPLSGAAEALNERAEEMGLWHLTQKTGEGLKMYAIDVGATEWTPLDETLFDVEWDPSGKEVEAALSFVLDPGKDYSSVADPSEGRPFTYAQPLRPIGAAGDFENDLERTIEVTSTGDSGFGFRVETPIPFETLDRTGVVPTGDRTRAWTAANAVKNYADDRVHFGIANDTKEWLVEIEPEETTGKWTVTYHKASERSAATNTFSTLKEAIFEAARFVDEGDQWEYVPAEYIDNTISLWQDERRNPSGVVAPEELQPNAVRRLAYDIRRDLWNEDHYTKRAHDFTGDILYLAERMEEGEVPTGDPRALQPLPLDQLASTTRSGLTSEMSVIGDMRHLSEYASDEVIPLVPDDPEEGFAPKTFDPYEEKGVWAIVRRAHQEARSWQSAGWLLPDGTAISLGGSSTIPRSQDHREIQVQDRFLREDLDTSKNVSVLIEAKQRGAVRTSKVGDSLLLDMNTPLTADQRRWVRREVGGPHPPKEVNVSVYETTHDGSTTRYEEAVFGPEPERVISFVGSFYSENGGSKVVKMRRRINPEDVDWTVPGPDKADEPRPKYDENHRLVAMSPEKYLELIRGHFMRNDKIGPIEARRATTREDPAVRPDIIEDMKDRIVNERPLDPPWLEVLLKSEVDENRSPVVSQEGRHRAIGAKELGAPFIPVILFGAEKGKSQFGDFEISRRVRRIESGERFPREVTTGTTEIEWPDTSRALSELLREARFNAQDATT